MKIASSLLAAFAFADDSVCDDRYQITQLTQRCVAVVTSSAFEDKFHSKWTVKCGKQSTRLHRIYDRCGHCVPGYVVDFLENPVTESCAAVTELADQNIDWLSAHVTSPWCAARVAQVSLSMNKPMLSYKKIISFETLK